MEALQRLHNRGSISTGYNIDNSIKVERLNNEWFYRSSPTASSTQTTFTFSFWHKRTQLESYPADPYLMSQGTNARFHFAGNTLRFMWDGGTTELESTQRLRDTAAWYHIVLAVDTTQATAANRVKVYVNGVQFAWSNTKYPTQNSTSTWMSTTNMYFNVRDGDGSYDSSGYWAEVCVIDGQQLAPTEFGEFDSDSGIWKPIDVSGLTFGNEGFYLKFDNASSLGADSSGNSNDCTLNNLTSADQATDTPTNNFVTFIGDGSAWNANSLDNAYTKEGATTVYHGATTGWSTIPTTQGVYGGKWYAELKWNSSYVNLFWGVLPVSRMGELPLNTYLGATDAHDGFGFYTDSTRVRYYEGTVVSPPTNTLANGDIIQIAMDKDNGYVYFGINNTWTQDVNSVTGVPTSGSSGTGGWAMNYDDAYCFAASLYNPSAEFPTNFGGFTTMTISSSASDGNGYGNFEYAPPTGYYALCTKNLAEYGG